MTARPVLALLGGGVLVLGVGAALLARATSYYLDHPLAPSSTSGVRVFRMPDGSLGGFEAFVLGFEPLVVGVGLLLVVAALVLGAVGSSARD